MRKPEILSTRNGAAIGILLSLFSLHAGEVEMVIGLPLEGESGLVARHGEALKSPFGADFDPQGRLYVMELEGGRVHRLGTDGVLTRVSGNGTRGYAGDGMEASHAVFNGMHNLAISKDEQLYLSDSWNHCVRKIDLSSGLISTVLGTGEPGDRGDEGPGYMAQFNFLMCVTLSWAEDALLIADLRNRRIRRWDLQTEQVLTLAGNGLKGVPQDGARASDSPLVDPRAVADDAAGNIYVLERGGHCLRRINSGGRIETVVGDGIAGFRDGPAHEARLNSPKHLAVDRSGRVFIADDQNAAIRIYDPAQDRIQTVLGREEHGQGIRLSRPHGVCVEGTWLYVVDTGHHRVLRLPLP
mgnify:CR=1 FL=1